MGDKIKRDKSRRRPVIMDEGMISHKVSILLAGYSPEKVWVKVLGMLQQNWAFVEKRPEIFMIHFFDDHKEIFDQLEFKTNDLAVAGLIKNGFEPSSIHEGFIQTLNYDANFKIAYDFDRRKTYSSGKYWISPDDKDPSEWVSKGGGIPFLDPETLLDDVEQYSSQKIKNISFQEPPINDETLENFNEKKIAEQRIRETKVRLLKLEPEGKKDP